MKKILIVGGGTAGWLTALILNRNFPELNVELIESSEIGILGAGESTLFNFRSELIKLGIDEFDFIKKTKGTFKLGSRYDGWNGDSDFHYSTTHPWHGDINCEAYGGNIEDYHTYLFANEIDIKTRGMYKIALNNKSPFILRNGNVEKINDFALHINARLTSQYFRKIGESRGVIRHEGKVVKINGGEIITSVQDDSGRIHSFDFIFDCSGFSRIIIGKHYKSNWIDYNKIFKVDSAIPFFIDNVGQEIPAYSRSTAMDYGWMFKIPTQDRYGSGYIFDSTKIDAEQAKVELINKVGHDVEILNHFKFKAGHYDEVYRGNCIALCLAGGFLEPMTASNISSMISQFTLLCGKFITDANNPSFRKTFNQYTSELYKSYSKWIFLHYTGKRSGTEFWDSIKEDHSYPYGYKQMMQTHIIDEGFNVSALTDCMSIPPDKIITVFQAYDLYKEQAKAKCIKFNLNEKYKKIDDIIVKNTERLLQYSIGHREFLDNYL